MRRVAYLLGTLLLAACAEPGRQAPNPEGHMAVLGPDPGFNIDQLASDWVVAGRRDLVRTNLTPDVREGVPALSVRATDEPYIAVRRSNAYLLATPYLSWAWYMTDQGDGVHPVRLVLGFAGGRTDLEEPTTLHRIAKALLPDIEGPLPDHDRALSLVWGDTALRRGDLSLPTAATADQAQAPVYTVRGGREQTGRWWLETVDIAALYAQAWPNDRVKDAKIVFIGVAAAPHPTDVKGRISGVLLSH